MFKPGQSGNRAGRVSVSALSASINAALLDEHPDASASQRVLITTASRLLAQAQTTPNTSRSAKLCAEARSLLRQITNGRAARAKASTGALSLDRYLSSSERERASERGKAIAGHPVTEGRS